jgi:FKBP-type peptidyl-prolyl cis-trans isomerase FklB
MNNSLIIAVLIISSLIYVSFAGDVNSYTKRTGAKFLQEVAQRDGIVQLKSGMLVEILKSSTDPDAKSPTKSDTCEVTYSGTFKDGKKFDSGTTSFAPNQVIKGWTEAMQLMGEGDKWKLYIPYNLAYGERGSPPRIPAYSPLVFEIEIHKVKFGGKPIAEARELFEKAKVSKEDL